MRLEVTRKADLAVRAMVALAEADTRLKASALADHLGSTAGFISQVVNPLVKEGWVTSDPGPTGGYRLTVDPSGISVLAVVEAIDGPTDDGRCVVADRACDANDPCALHHAWTMARAELTETLSGVVIAGLLSPDPHRLADRPAVAGR